MVLPQRSVTLELLALLLTELRHAHVAQMAI